jgi:hypothetical protein
MFFGLLFLLWLFLFLTSEVTTFTSRADWGFCALLGHRECLVSHVIRASSPTGNDRRRSIHICNLGNIHHPNEVSGLRYLSFSFFLLSI